MKQFLFTMILFIGLFLSFTGYSQDTIAKNGYEVKCSEKIERPNAIFFAPLNLFDFVNPNFQIGYERFVSKKCAVQIEGGIIINHSIENYVIDWIKGINIRECSHTNKGFLMKGSVKYVLLEKKIITLSDLCSSFMKSVLGFYFNLGRLSDYKEETKSKFQNLPKRTVKLYISPEIFYLRNKSGITRDFLVSDPNFEYSFGIVPNGKNAYTQFFYNDEEKMGVNFKLGFKIFYGTHFFVEHHLGIGLAYRNVVQTGRENPNDKLYGSFGIFDNAAPNKWVPTIPYNFKIGFQF